MTSGDNDATRTGLHAHADLETGAILAGRFRIESLLGVGGMGVVYRATDLSLDVPVALKLLRPELASRPEAFERFRQELLLARQVSNPHVVRIHDIAQHEGRWLISMDYIEGESLDRRLDREERMAPDEALRIARQVALGLGAAHARGVVHRDLKPANILIDREGNAYVNDFGVARSLVSSGMTQSGSVVGTPDYLSPEQARGETVGPRSDLYALGLILYEMLSGELPFSGGTVAEVLGQRMVRTPVPVTRKRPELPAWIARLLDKLLRPQPAHRFRDAEALVAAIDAGSMPREFHPGRRGWFAFAGLLLALGLIMAGWWWWQQRGGDAVVVQLPPLQRVLVLPIEAAPAAGASAGAEAGADAALDDRLRALSDRLREVISSAGVAVVDSERTWQALRQLDPTGTARMNVDGLRGVAAADRALRIRLQREGAGWRMQASLHGGADGPVPIAGPVAADPVGALEAGLAPLATALGLAPDALALDLPPVAVLQQHGAGLRQQQGGDHAAALTTFQAATEAAPDDPWLWLAQVDAAQAIGELAAADAAIAGASEAAGNAPERLRQRMEALAAALEGDMATAVARWQALAQSQPDNTRAALQLARARGASGDFETAIAELRALTAKDDNDPRAWYELGKFSIMQGDARRAVDDYLVRALVLYKRSRDLYGQAETVNALGVGYGRLGQTADAEEQYRKAVELRRAVGNRRGVATSLRNLASVVSLRGEFAAARSHLEEARTLYEALGDRDGLAATDNEAGLLAEERGDYPQALEAFRSALQAWQQSGDTYRAAEALNSIGYAHYQLGAYDSAQAFWRQSADAFARLGDLTGEIRTSQNLALLDIARGRWREAREPLERTRQQAEQQQMLEEVAVSRRNLAELALWEGRIDLALHEAAQAEALFRQRDDQRGATDAGLLRVQALLAAGATVQARQALQALREPLAQASSEQQAMAALVEAGIARQERARTQENAALAEASRLARESGVRQLQLHAQLQRAAQGRADPTLDVETARLGHAGLRLAWLEQAMARALARGDIDTVLEHYAEVRERLRDKAYLRAHVLHRLAHRAYLAAGDARAAEEAQAAADAALEAVRARIPEELREAFAANLQE